MNSEGHTVTELVHDLRNPLNSISMTAELAKLQIEQGEDAKAVVANLETILRICHDCGATLDRFSHSNSPRSGSSRAEASDECDDDVDSGI